ncbi:helix-turn-helix domain-containing protein [Acetobacter estunensis]|nr:helix-turn-helix domain-containing protein [Acetobacter estunensis]
MSGSADERNGQDAAGPGDGPMTVGDVTETGPATETASVDPANIPLPDFHALGVGQALRIRRESLGWALPDVAEWLRIRADYLDALEHNRADGMPAGSYAIGFLRTYAAALGFPAEEMVRRFKHEVRGAARKVDLVFPAPPPERTVPAGALVLLGLVVIVGAYAGWYTLVGHDPVPLERVPPVASVIPGMGKSASPSPQIASVMPQSGPSPLPQAPSANTSPPAPVAAGNGNMPAASVMAGTSDADTSLPVTTQAFPPQPVDEAAKPADAASSAPPSDAPVIRAVAASWVQVRDGEGHSIYDHIMQPGDTWSPPEEGGPFTFTVGNAGGIRLASGYMTTAPLGRNGAVRRNMPLSAEAILDGTLAAPAPPGDVPPPVLPVAHPPDDAASSEATADVPLPPPPVRPRMRQPKVEHHEMSADDLNARQLKGMGTVRP